MIMLKYTHTGNRRYDQAGGYIPKNWIETHKSELDTINSYFEARIKVYDADICGDQTHDFLFSNGKAYRLEYSWYCNTAEEKDDWGEVPWIIDEVHVAEITKAKANVPDKSNRDWL